MDKTIEKNAKTVERLKNHIGRYPKSEINDIFKFLFQSSFGCEHLISNRSAAAEYILREYEGSLSVENNLADELDGDYSRVHLSCLNDGISIDTFAKIFCLSAKKEEKGYEDLRVKLAVTEEMIKRGDLAYDHDDFIKKLSEWRERGFPALHHSDRFRDEYRPAYRVIANKYVEYIDVLSKIDAMLSEKDSVTVAIEGGSASGKSTLANILSEVYDCNVFHMDDFFLRPEQRTKARLDEVGGNVDRERFAKEVLVSLVKGETVCYRPFDCSTQTIGEAISTVPKKLTIVEGVYSTHPEFNRYYDLAIFLDVDHEIQRKRILKRNSPQLAKRFFEEWIPLENKYFLATDIKNRSDLIHMIRK